jgi:hypothetical protein
MRNIPLIEADFHAAWSPRTPGSEYLFKMPRAAKIQTQPP